MLTAAPSRDTAVDSSFGIGELFLTFRPTLHSDSGGQFHMPTYLVLSLLTRYLFGLLWYADSTISTMRKERESTTPWYIHILRQTLESLYCEIALYLGTIRNHF